jgi:hypothetical protein
MQRYWELRANPLVEKYNNIVSFVTSSISLMSLVAYQYFDYNTFLQPTTYVIFSYCCVDMFFCKKEMVLHHLFTMSAISFTILHNMSIYDSSYIYLAIMSSELSSIFYIFNYWMSDLNGTFMKIVKSINLILFTTAFTKLCVYDYYYFLTNPETYTIISKYTDNNILNSLYAYSGVFGLFILNLYWFSLICKKIYKSVIIQYVPKINTDYTAELFLQYTFFSNLYAVISRYGSNDVFFYDVVGITTLTFGSFIYHRTLVNNYKTNTVINYTSKDIIFPYIFDTLSIHIRSFCVALTNYMQDTPYKHNRLLFTAVVHIVAMITFLTYLIKLLVKGEKFIYDSDSKEPNHYKTLFYLLVMVPSGIDILLIFYNTPSITANMDLLIINCVVAILIVVQPFYKLNHLMIHGAIYVQTHALINCNMIMDSQQSPSPYV